MIHLLKLLRSFRFRVAILVALVIGFLAYRYTEGIVWVIRLQNQAQLRYEVRTGLYDLANLLHDHGFINLVGDPVDLTKKAPDDSRQSEAIQKVFGTNQYAGNLAWALLDRNERFIVGSDRPEVQAPPADSPNGTATSGEGMEKEADVVLDSGYFIGGNSLRIEQWNVTSTEPGITLGILLLGEGKLRVWHNRELLDRKVRMAWYYSAQRGIPFALIGGVITWFILTYSLRPVRRIARLSKEFSVTNLDMRIPLKNEPSEFDELVDLLNHMLNRLQDNVRRITEFSDNASHELKTPLTILQGKLELALAHVEDESEEQFRNLELLEEVQKLIQITDTLLLLSKSDRNELLAHSERVDLSKIVSAVFELCQLLDEDLHYECDIPPGISIEGDPQLIQQLVMNLTTNAIRHNRPGGYVHLSLNANEKMAQVRVENSGTQISDEKAMHVFDRFYRTDPARSRETGGMGLGLNLASEIARAHGGSIVLETNEPDRITFRADLPMEQSSKTRA